jgi:hypothetical protein
MIQRDLASYDGDAVGAMVWWDLLDVHVRRGDLEDYMREAGLDPDQFMPGAQKAETHFHKAVRRHQRDAGKGFLIRPYPKPPVDKVIYCVVKDIADEVNLTLSGDTIATMTYDRNLESLDIEGTAGVTATIANTWRDYVANQIVTTGDLRRKMEETFMQLLGATRIRRSGPPYYILGPYLKEIYAHRKVIEMIEQRGGAVESFLYVTPIPEAGDMARKAQRGLQEELQDLAKQIEEFRSGDKKTRPDTLRRRLEEFEALRGKIDLYASMLQFKSDDLIQASKDLDAIVEGMLAGDADDESEAA